MKIGFLINPIAGMGGRVGLKGTDGVLSEAIIRGAEPVSGNRAQQALSMFSNLLLTLHNEGKYLDTKIEWYTCSGRMGYNILQKSGITNLKNNEVNIIYDLQTSKKNSQAKNQEPLEDTSASDTKSCCKELLKHNVDLILFCGGDGTARDVYSVVKDRALILGIPSGVKMHSGVFAYNSEIISEILIDFIKGTLDSADGEILDLDEDRYRDGEWNIRLFGIAKTPHEPSLIQRGKHMVETASENEIKEEIAEYIQEEIESEPDVLYIFGSGSTVQAVALHLGIESTLLGIDAIHNGEIIGTDLNEADLLGLIEKYKKVKLLLSPIGAQGFILGRGNLQLSPNVIKRIGIDNIIVISTPAKLNNLEFLRVDTNDPDLDNEFKEKGYLKVIFRYRQMRLKKLSN